METNPLALIRHGVGATLVVARPGVVQAAGTGRAGEDSAWVEFYWNFEATRPNGMELSTSGRETQVLRRENGAWQIRNVHYSAMPTQVEGEGF